MPNEQLMVTITPTGKGAAFRDPLRLWGSHDPACAAVDLTVYGQRRTFSLVSGREIGGDQAWMVSPQELDRLRQVLALNEGVKWTLTLNAISYRCLRRRGIFVVEMREQQHSCWCHLTSGDSAEALLVLVSGAVARASLKCVR